MCKPVGSGPPPQIPTQVPPSKPSGCDAPPPPPGGPIAPTPLRGGGATADTRSGAHALYAAFDRQYLVPLSSPGNPYATAADALNDAYNLLSARDKRARDISIELSRHASQTGQFDALAMQRLQMEQSANATARAALDKLVPIKGQLTHQDRTELLTAVKHMAATGGTAGLTDAVNRILLRH